MNVENQKQIKKGMNYQQARAFDKIHLAKSKLLFLQYKYKVQDIDDFRPEEVKNDELFREMLEESILRYETKLK